MTRARAGWLAARQSSRAGSPNRPPLRSSGRLLQAAVVEEQGRSERSLRPAVGGAQAKLVLVFPATQMARQLLQAGSPAPTPARAWGLAGAWQLRRAEERAELPARNRAAGLLWLVAAAAVTHVEAGRGPRRRRANDGGWEGAAPQWPASRRRRTGAGARPQRLARAQAVRRSIRAGRVGRRSIRAGAAKEEQLTTEVLTSGSGASKAGAIPASIYVEEQQRANEASPRGWPRSSRARPGGEQRRRGGEKGLDLLWIRFSLAEKQELARWVRLSARQVEGRRSTVRSCYAVGATTSAALRRCDRTWCRVASRPWWSSRREERGRRRAGVAAPASLAQVNAVALLLADSGQPGRVQLP
ncbi:unnamed protein product [Urochloa humidicola]